ARLRYEISKYIHIDARNIHAYILGEHGDSEFVCWSKAYVGTKPMLDVIESMNEINFEDLDHIYAKVKNAAQEIIKRKNATYYGIGMALVRISSAIFDNENSILPISVYNNGVYDIDPDLYIGLPAVINRDGVHHVVNLKLSDDEQEKLKRSAKILKDSLSQMSL
ncbi:MAG: L-lactate dehydrogenase, partial [Tenericutes bacterium HGW-Tenericutes-7]